MFAIINKISKLISQQWWQLQWGVVVYKPDSLSPGGDIYQFFSAMTFISVLLGILDFSDIVILCGRPNSCCQQSLKCFDMPLLSSGLFS